MEKSEIKVKLFGIIREAVGANAFILGIIPGTKAGDILPLLQKKFPAVKAISSRLLIAVNGKVVTLDSEINPGDEVAILPPFSGG